MLQQFNIIVSCLYLLLSLCGLFILLKTRKYRRYTFFLSLLAIAPFVLYFILGLFVERIGHQRNFYFILPIFIFFIVIFISVLNRYIRVAVSLIIFFTSLILSKPYLEMALHRKVINKMYNYVSNKSKCNLFIANLNDKRTVIALNKIYSIPYIQSNSFEPSSLFENQIINWINYLDSICDNEFFIHDLNTNFKTSFISEKCNLIESKQFTSNLSFPYSLFIYTQTKNLISFKCSNRTLA
jgi:hypothetical protein